MGKKIEVLASLERKKGSGGELKNLERGEIRK